MKLLYGTGNVAKLADMRQRLACLDITLSGLGDMNGMIPEVSEQGATPLENARQKAEVYYRAFHIPVFSCDTGLYLDGVPDELQPGVHVRRVCGKNLTDEEMIVYYSGLASKYGRLKARYKNAVCLIMDEQHRYEAMTAAMESREFLIAEKPHAVVEKGFPLDSLAVDLRTGKYYNDLPQDAWQREEDGFLEFFRAVSSAAF